jgi:hypothetical protein
MGLRECGECKLAHFSFGCFVTPYQLRSYALTDRTPCADSEFLLVTLETLPFAAALKCRAVSNFVSSHMDIFSKEIKF